MTTLPHHTTRLRRQFNANSSLSTVYNSRHVICRTLNAQNGQNMVLMMITPKRSSLRASGHITAFTDDVLSRTPVHSRPVREFIKNSHTWYTEKN